MKNYYMSVSTVILAAGASSRMGQPKALLKWKNKTFLENICDNLYQAGTGEIVIVTSISIGQKCRLLMTKNADTIFAINPHPEQGMLSSFRCGLHALKSSDKNVMLCLTDHPMVEVKTYRILFSAAKKNKIIIPKYKNRRGHPVIFGADFISELLEKDCPEGARTIVRAHPESVEEILVDDDGILLDIDTSEDAKAVGIKV